MCTAATFLICGPAIRQGRGWNDSVTQSTIRTATFLICGPANHLSISRRAANVLVLFSTEYILMYVHIEDNAID